MDSTDFDPDAALSVLIAQLHLNDIDEINASRKGKARQGASLSDEELALQIQADSFRDWAGTIEDRRLAMSISRALGSDQEYLHALSVVELGAQDDHAAALALSTGQELPPVSAAQQALDGLSFPEAPDSDLDGDSSIATDVGTDAPESSTVPFRFREFTSSVECVVCSDSHRTFLTLRAPCGHHYCRGCLRELTEAATRDESLYPLRCCRQNFPIKDVRPLLDPQLRTLFHAKSEEFGTPSIHRLYCPNLTCSIFLGSCEGAIGNTVCHQCFTRICMACKNQSHPNEACGESAALLDLKALAREEHWQTCPGCNAIVELVHGCNHITCKCRAEFCYLCSVPWKHCSCPQWDENLLYNDAHRRVVNEFGEQAAVAEPVVHADRVHQMVADLRIDHGCDYHRWSFSHGQGLCEECGSYLPVFLMRCINCQIRVCRRCSRNRF